MSNQDSKLSGSTPLALLQKVVCKPKTTEVEEEPKVELIKEPIQWADKFSWLFTLMSWIKGKGSNLAASSKGAGTNLFVKTIYEPLLSLSFIIMPLMMIWAIHDFYKPQELSSTLLATLGISINIAALIYTGCSWIAAYTSETKVDEHRKPVPIIASFITMISVMALNMIILLNSVFSEDHVWMIALGGVYLVLALGINVYRTDKVEKWDE